MFSVIVKNWWTFVLRGALAILFGILALVMPSATLVTLVVLFGIFTLTEGIFAVIAGIASHDVNQRWWAILLDGVVDILIGIAAFVWPQITALALLYLIAAWALVTGAFQIVAAIQLRKEILNEWALGLGGLASVLFGVLLILFPGAGALSVIWIIGIYALLFGVLLIILGFRLKNYRLPSPL